MVNSAARAGVERNFLARAESVGEARRFVMDALADDDVDGIDAAVLTSELAANAVLHANTDFWVRVECRLDAVRVEIVNDAPELLLIIKEPSADGGRGLQILDGLAKSWGIETRSDEKVVWFELERRRASHD